MFDRYEQIGGLLQFGIPSFKLDKSVIATRREVLEDMGVRFRLGVEIGRDLDMAELRACSHAVVLCHGAALGRSDRAGQAGDGLLGQQGLGGNGQAFGQGWFPATGSRWQGVPRGGRQCSGMPGPAVHLPSPGRTFRGPA